MFEIDARGEVCPRPVILARNALKEHGTVHITVDNEIASKNLEKMAAGNGHGYSLEMSGNDFVVTLIAGEKAAEGSEPIRGYTVVSIPSEYMGTGDNELGLALMKSFVYALTEMDIPPDTLILYNGGAKLSVEGSPSLDDLKRLAASGVEILTCGTCLNFYGIADKLGVGEVTNMYSIIEVLSDAEKVISP